MSRSCPHLSLFFFLLVSPRWLTLSTTPITRTHPRTDLLRRISTSIHDAVASLWFNPIGDPILFFLSLVQPKPRMHLPQYRLPLYDFTPLFLSVIPGPVIQPPLYTLFTTSTFTDPFLFFALYVYLLHVTCVAKEQVSNRDINRLYVWREAMNH